MIKNETALACLDCAENHTSIQAFEQSSWIQAFEQSSWLDEVLSFRSQVLTTICLKNAAPTDMKTL